MKLKTLLAGLKYEILQGTDEIEVGKVTNDSREITSKDVYVCIMGYHTDGHNYAYEALQAGAAAIVIQTEEVFRRGIRMESDDGIGLVDKRIEVVKALNGVVCEQPCPTIIRVTDTRYALAMMSAASYHYPARQLRMIGVTGTKGKTTTAWMIRSILENAGYKTGLIGTIQIDTGNDISHNRNTTPESCQVQTALREMVDAGCEYAVMEVSSQALKLCRVAGIWFDIGIYTNLGLDHISPEEHADMEDYAQCKHLLFLQCEVGIGNVDDAYYEEIFWRTKCRRITYSLQQKADYRATEVRLKQDDSGYGITCLVNERKMELSIPGRFNIYNALGAVAALRELGIDYEMIQQGMSHIQVPGRMEQIVLPGERSVFVDYAHNAMSLEQVLLILREYRRGRIILVFGCGGNRSKARRYEMGKVAGRLADDTIITTDNPRFEEPRAIMEDIAIGLQESKGAYKMIEDRKIAIFHAIEESRKWDVIVIAGKGHEDYQEIEGVRYAANDAQFVREAVRQ